jgi:hypothetical protein
MSHEDISLSQSQHPWNRVTVTVSIPEYSEPITVTMSQLSSTLSQEPHNHPAKALNPLSTLSHTHCVPQGTVTLYDSHSKSCCHNHCPRSTVTLSQSLCGNTQLPYHRGTIQEAHSHCVTVTGAHEERAKAAELVRHQKLEGRQEVTIRAPPQHTHPHYTVT